MCVLCEQRIIGDVKMQEKLRRLVHNVVEAMAPQEVWLFGSFAYGDWHELSDVDLLIVAPAEGRLIDRDLTLSEVNETGLPVEALIYTPEEYTEMVRNESPLITTVLEDGVRLYERPEPA